MIISGCDTKARNQKNIKEAEVPTLEGIWWLLMYHKKHIHRISHPSSSQNNDPPYLASKSACIKGALGRKRLPPPPGLRRFPPESGTSCFIAPYFSLVVSFLVIAVSFGEVWKCSQYITWEISTRNWHIITNCFTSHIIFGHYCQFWWDVKTLTTGPRTPWLSCKPWQEVLAKDPLACRTHDV